MATYTKTVDPNGGADYSSLSAWEAGEQTSYSSGDIAIADCRRTGATKDTTAVTVAGWTAGVIPKIIVNASYRHEGKWADTRASDGNYVYILQLSTGTNHGIYFNQAGSFTLEGLSVTGSTGQTLFQAENGTATVTSNIFKDHATTLARAVVRFLAGTDHVCANNVVYGASNAQDGIEWSVNGTCYNNTVYDCAGIGILRLGGTVTCKNNVSMGNAGGDFSGTFSSPDYNVSSDATAVGTNKATGKTSYTDYFVDPANGDFHLKGSSSTLWGLAGTDLSGTFTTDIDGDTRSAWDIGADEYVAAGGGGWQPWFARPSAHIIGSL